MLRTLLSASLCLAVALASASDSQEAVPQRVAYMGYLTDAADSVVEDGDHELTFRLYGQTTGGDAVWTSTRTVTTSGGLFSVVLGESESMDGLPFDRPYSLGISVGSGDELSPRVSLVASPYSLHAKSVEDGAVTAAKIAADAVGGEQVADGSLTAADVSVSSNAMATANIQDGAVTAARLASGAAVTSVNDATDDVTTWESMPLAILPWSTRK